MSIDKLAQKLAQMYKDNINPPSTAPQIAEVVGINPVKIKWGDIIITADKLFLPKLYTTGYMIPNRYMNLSGNIIDEEILWKVDLQIGDRVIVIPDANYKMFYLIDRM